MATLHPDLLLLAAVVQAYGFGQVADNCYALVQASSYLTPPLQPGDVQKGLQLMGLGSYRIVGPGLEVPDILWDAVCMGHVVLAQVHGHPLRKRAYWCALVEQTADGWGGLTVANDWGQCSISDQLGSTLTGHFVAVATALPDWQP